MTKTISIQQDTDKTKSGKVTWKSPSNIALVKYWGKKKGQIPSNPSISFTLSEAHTISSVEYASRNGDNAWIEFSLEGRRETAFEQRIEKYFLSLGKTCPFLSEYRYKIDSYNSFPHSSGIASSASGMSALALCICQIENTLKGTPVTTGEAFLQRASFLARLGSGSAARSVFPFASVWGKTNLVEGSSDHYGIPFEDVHPIFRSFHDDILIVSTEKKSVSSSIGHSLMNTNPYAQTRYSQASSHLNSIIQSMVGGDLSGFGDIVENEALTLHALMMCSDPSYILMKPNTLNILNLIRKYRKDTNIPVFFTLDAGPNVHVLYPDENASEVSEFIASELTPFTEGARIIRDIIGDGPVQLSYE